MANVYYFPGKMNDQQLNILFVREVEKRPVLYNFTLPGYSNKDETERAWVEVGRQVNMLSSECKERWKNLRAVFVRHMKSSKGGPGAKAKKAYYLSEAMQFTAPYIKALSATSENLPSPLQQKEECEQFEDNDSDSDSTLSLSKSISPHSCQHSTSIADIGQPSRKDNLLESPMSHTSNKRPHSNNNQAFANYIQTKKRRLLLKSDYSSQDQRTEALQMFLLSMLPDLQKMTDEEVRRFKRKTLDAVDEIFLSRSTISSASTTPTSQIEVLLPTADIKPEFI